MLVTRPDAVTFGGGVWDGVERVAIERFSLDMAESWGTGGPHMVFADSVRRKTAVRVVQALSGDDLGGPELGAIGTLRVTLSRGSDAGARELSCVCVVQSVSYGVGGDRAWREVRLLATSATGASAPITVTGAGEGGV